MVQAVTNLAKFLEAGYMNKSSRGLIFCPDIPHVEEIARNLGNAHSHAKMDPGDRNGYEQGWQNGSFTWLTATTGFIQGVDHPNVDVVIMASIPYGLINIVQGFGRAGRSGNPAYVFMLSDTRTYYLQNEYEADDYQCLAAAKEWINNTTACRREHLSTIMDGAPITCQQLAGAELCNICGPDTDINNNLTSIVKNTFHSKDAAFISNLGSAANLPLKETTPHNPLCPIVTDVPDFYPGKVLVPDTPASSTKILSGNDFTSRMPEEPMQVDEYDNVDMSDWWTDKELANLDISIFQDSIVDCPTRDPPTLVTGSTASKPPQSVKATALHPPTHNLSTQFQTGFSILLDTALHTGANNKKSVKAQLLSSVCTALLGKCPICWLLRGEYVAKGPHHKVYVDCKGSGISSSFGWHAVKKQMKLRPYQYCYRCGFPQGKHAPAQHPAVGRDHPKCPFEDFTAQVLYFIWHNPQWLRRAQIVVPQLVSKTTMVEFVKWAGQEDGNDSFYNGLELLIAMFGTQSGEVPRPLAL